MKTRMTRSKGIIEVSYDDPKNEYGTTVVVAAMSLFEGTGCWMVSDWRLSEYKVLSPYSASLNASDCCSRFIPKSPEERALVISLLREYDELADGAIVWCTFDNFYRGHPDVKGVRPGFRTCHQSGYFGYKEALAKLREIKSFWDTFEGDPETARMENPNRQPSESSVTMALVIAAMDGRIPPPPPRMKRQRRGLEPR
jgi:hypothetical protein